MFPSASFTAVNASYFQCSCGGVRAAHLMPSLWHRARCSGYGQGGRGLPGRPGPRPCGNSTGLTSEPGGFPPRSWWSRPCEGKAGRLQTVLKVYPLLSTFLQCYTGWYKGGGVQCITLLGHTSIFFIGNSSSSAILSKKRRAASVEA